jgi:hypothetical protein
MLPDEYAKFLEGILKGKTIERVDCSREQEFVVLHFKDGGMVLINSKPWNCGGARLEFKLSL